MVNLKKDDFLDELSEYYAVSNEKKERRKRKQLLYISATSVYAVLFSVFFAFTYVTDLSNFFVGNPVGDVDKKLEELERKNKEVREKLDSLDKSFNGNVDLSEYLLSKRIDKVESEQRVIQETILFDTDKAITSRILRDRQDVIQKDIDEINSAYIRLNDKLDNFILAVFIIPIVTALLGIAWSYFSPSKKEG